MYVGEPSLGRGLIPRPLRTLVWNSVSTAFHRESKEAQTSTPPLAPKADALGTCDAFGVADVDGGNAPYSIKKYIRIF